MSNLKYCLGFRRKIRFASKCFIYSWNLVKSIDRNFWISKWTEDFFWSCIFMDIRINFNSLCKATCIWKFVQHNFITSKLNMGCGGYLDKIYKILDGIFDLKASFPLANFFIRSNFFRSKTMKSRIGFYFFYFEKSH